MPSSNNTRDNSAREHHQRVNTEITLITFFAVKDEDTLYSQQTQDLAVTVAQIISFLLQIQA